jgi:hypothetical protein
VDFNQGKQEKIVDNFPKNSGCGHVVNIFHRAFMPKKQRKNESYKENINSYPQVINKMWIICLKVWKSCQYIKNTESNIKIT